MATDRSIQYNLPGLSDFSQEISRVFKTHLKDTISEILDQIAQEHNIDNEELKDKYLPTLDSTELELNDTENDAIKKRKKPRKAIPESSRCMAKVANGGQCQRRKKGEYSEYCGQHASSRPYGRVDGTTQSNTSSVWDTRPKSIDLDPDMDPEDYDLLSLKGTDYVLYNYSLYKMPDDYTEDDEIDLEKMQVCATVDQNGSLTQDD